MRKLLSIFFALLSALAAVFVGQGTAQATCGSQPIVYNFSDAVVYGPPGSVPLNGWIDNCQNYNVTLNPGQDSSTITSPANRFDPEYIGTTLCWAVTLRVYQYGSVVNGNYTFNYYSPGVTYSGGKAWAKLGDGGWRYDVKSVTPSGFC